MARLTGRCPWLWAAWFPWMCFSVVALLASVHRIWLVAGAFNNYRIFSRSFGHLVQGVNLYAAYPGEHGDLFKYSPAFALLMAPFSLVPEAIGVILWNLLNMLAPVWAVGKLRLEPRQKSLILFLIFLELLTSVQNAQSNGLMLGLILGAFAFSRIENRSWRCCFWGLDSTSNFSP